MKKTYIKPVFIAEAYNFNESFAVGCTVDPDVDDYTHTYRMNDAVCGQCNGDKFNGAGNIKEQVVVMFNDGVGVGKCMYDWGGPSTQVTDPHGNEIGTWAQAFYGNNDNDQKHAPGYTNNTFYHS